MKTLKEQNPMILVLAIIGVCALLYGGWTIYQRHVAEQLEHAIRYGPPPPGFPQLNKPNREPPPPQ
jgi:hypothetical protein